MNESSYFIDAANSQPSIFYSVLLILDLTCSESIFFFRTITANLNAQWVNNNSDHPCWIVRLTLAIHRRRCCPM